MESKNSPLIWGVVLVLIGALVFLDHSFKVADDTQHKYLVPPPEHIELFHFGFADMVADSLWLRWIQDNDYCQTYAGMVPAHPISGTTTGDFRNPRHKFCDNSWSYKMLDAVTLLAPKFRMPYFAGAVTLSVLVEDYEGAKKIFDRGVENFPDDWMILYRASYHYLFDRQDLTTAASLLVRAQKSPGAPYWLALLGARLYTKAGQLELGLQTLESYRKTMKDNPKAVADIDNRIANIKKQLSQ
jgi:tetratricopeptide (TPR) repeat protein